MIQEIQKLNYARRLRLNKSRRGLSVILAIAIAISSIVFYLVRGRSSATPPSISVGLSISCNVAGTEVYRMGQKLGTVPLTLSAVELRNLGLPSGKFVYDFEGCEGVDIEGNPLGPRLMFRVPDTVSKAYSTIETPWGRRTKCSAGQLGSMRVNLKMLPKVSAAMLIDVTVPNQVTTDQDVVPVRVRLSNNSLRRVAGPRAELAVNWGSFLTPVSDRSSKILQLTTQWSDIGPGEYREQIIEIPTPNIASDYSLFVYYYLYKEDNGGELIMQVLSDSVLLRARR